MNSLLLFDDSVYGPWIVPAGVARSLQCAPSKCARVAAVKY